MSTASPDPINSPSQAVLVDEDDDDISLTSTIEEPEDPEKLWDAESVLAERDAPSDDEETDRYFLIRWLDFPLPESTWEPRHNVSLDLMVTWEEAKVQFENGTSEPFDVDIYNQARAEYLEARDQRKARRQAKRERLLQKKIARTAQRLLKKRKDHNKRSDTDFFDDIGSDSSYEADEHDTVDDLVLPGSRASRKPSQKSQSPHIEETQQGREKPKQQLPEPRQTIFQPIGQAEALVAGKSADKLEPKRRASTDKLLPKAPSGSKAKAPSTSTLNRTEPASATGYKGTARKPSNVAGKSNTAAVSRPGLLPGKSAPRPSVGSSATRLSTASKGSGLTARRTKQKPPASNPASIPFENGFMGNVFGGGKMRKKRTSLKEVVTDESRDKSLFPNHRIRRKAELNEREKDDREPERAQIAPMLFPIGKEPQRRNSVNTTPLQLSVNTMSAPSASSNSVAGILKSPTDGLVGQDGFPGPNKRRKSAQFSGDSMDAEAMSFEPMEIDSASPNGSSSAALPTGLSRPKKRKSVHFQDGHVVHILEDDDSDYRRPFVHEPMELGQAEHPSRSDFLNEILMQDRGLKPLAGTTMQKENQRPIIVTKKLSLSDYHKSKGLLVVSQKQVFIGFTGAALLTADFNGLPRDTGPPWATAFSEEHSLRFAHTCFAENFLSQWNGVRVAVVCQGTVTAKSDEDSAKLGIVADHLRSGAAGLYLSHPALNILVYPTKCDEWKAEHLDVDAPSPSDVALRFAIFTSNINCELFMVSPTDRASAKSDDAANSTALIRDTFMRNAFNLDKQAYSRLLHPRESHRPHVFFLVSPASRRDMLKQVGLWLRQQNPSCQILTSHEVGAWGKFRQMVPHVAGAVILHESAIPSVRRFPGLFTILQTTKCMFWLWSQPIEGPASFATVTDLDTDINPCHVQIGRLFPDGKYAILVTPSFLVSEPRQTYNFFKWYRDVVGSKGSRWRVVTTWDFGNYLRQLALDKAQERHGLLNSSDDNVVLREIQANIRGITHPECDHRFKTWALVREILGDGEYEKPMSAYDESSNFIYADRSISGSDEQSLINWFGWWSAMRLDEYRQFLVIGSSLKTQGYRCERAKHFMKIPEYTKETQPDPQAASSAIHLAPVLAPSVPQLQVQQADLPEKLRLLRDTSSSYYPLNRMPTLRLQDILRTDLMHLPKTHMHRVYGFPVWWKVRSDGWSEDITGAMKSTEEWWKFTWPFANREARDFCSYSAVFYTVDESPSDEPGAAQHDTAHRRHAWLVTYRISRQDIRPWNSTEVVIWDPAAPLLFPGQQKIREQDLSLDQQFVIQYIRNNAQKKNPTFPLERVWYGGLERTPGSQNFSNDLDMAVAFLGDMARDPGLHTPFSGDQLREKGYVVLEDAIKPSGSKPPPESLSSPSDNRNKTSEDSEDEDNKSIVFHPPAVTLSAGVTTKCRNSLYERARLARLRDNDAQFMEYEYKPTTEWYADQKAEGRGFEHINVDSWEGIFNHFTISGAVDGPSSAS